MANKELTAKFFRIIGSQEGVEYPLGSIDWRAMLDAYRNLPPGDRIWESRGVYYYFEPRDSGRHYLAAHRLKDASEVLSKIARNGGKVTEIQAVDDEGYLADTSCVIFLDYANVFGLVTSGASSPRASKIAEWLTRIDPFQDKTAFGAVPLSLLPDLERLNHADGASRVQMRVPVELLDAIGESLGAGGKAFSTAVPGSTVTLSVSYGRRRPKVSEGQGLLGIVRKLAELAVGPSGGSAEATIFHTVKGKKKGQTKLEGELLDLVEHEIAHSFTIGNQAGEVRIDAVLALMDNAAELEKSQLRRAWEACRAKEAQQGQALVD